MNAFKTMVGRLFMIGVEGLTLTDASKKALKDIQPGFVILFSRNTSHATQVKALIQEIQSMLEMPAVICIDQEGGLVTRLENDFTVSPGAMAIAATGQPSNAFSVGKIMGLEMGSVQITWDLAPVADLNTNPLNPSLGVRSFGDQATVATPYMLSFYQGLKAAGIAGCAKHFPGYGDVSLDPHLDLPTMDQDLEQLQEREFVPFQALIDSGIESIMPTHVYLQNIQHERIPATMDPAILGGILRDQLGYSGLIVADDLMMKGVANDYTLSESLREGFLAGLDVLTICHQPELQQAAFKELVQWVEAHPQHHTAIRTRYERVESFRNRFLADHWKGESWDRTSHKRAMDQIALDSITLFKNDDYLVPLPPLSHDDLIISVKPMRQSQAEEALGPLMLYQQLSVHFPNTPKMQFDPTISAHDAIQLIKPLKGKVCVFLSENAYLHPGQKEMIWGLLGKYERLLLIALRNPYDAGIEGLRNCLLSYGYAAPSQKALFDVLLGKHHPTGKCPVQIHLVTR